MKSTLMRLCSTATCLAVATALVGCSEADDSAKRTVEQELRRGHHGQNHRSHGRHHAGHGRHHAGHGHHRSGPGHRDGLTVAQDLNPDPNIVEIELVAEESTQELIDGVQTSMWTFNGSFPGPLIEGNVGDTLIVHFTNNLPQPSTIHWHGIELPAEMDGSNISQELVPPGGTFRYEFKLLNPATHWYHPHNKTDEQIERGLAGALVIRDPQEQHLLGIPRSRDRTFVLDDILLETDPASSDYGQIAPFAHEEDFLDSGTPAERAELIINGRDTEDNLLLVNGRPTGFDDPDDIPTIYVRQGVAERWRFANVANGRFMRLSVPDQVLHQVGSDGGLLEAPVERQPIGSVPVEHGDGMMSDPNPELGILLGVAERAEVVFIPEGDPGDVMYLQWHDFPRGLHRGVPEGTVLEDGSVCDPGPCITHAHDDGQRAPRNLLKIVVAPAKGVHHRPDYQVPSELRDLSDLRADVSLDDFAQALPVFFGHGNPNAEGLITLFAAVRDRDDLLADVRAREGRGSMPGNPRIAPPAYGPRPFPVVEQNPGELALQATVGETRYWEIVNFTGGDHPFHSHGFFFQPIEIEYVDLQNPAANRVVPWDRVELKDTVRVPARPGAITTSWTIVRAVTKISDEDRPPELQRAPEDLVAHGADPSSGIPGGWLDHCHIDEHARGGMMTFLEVFPSP